MGLGSEKRQRWTLAFAIVFALGACSSDPHASDVPEPTGAPSETGPASIAQDIMSLEPFADLEPGTYSIDPDLDPSTPLRVTYEIPTEGWRMWIGAGKFAERRRPEGPLV